MSQTSSSFELYRRETRSHINSTSGSLEELRYRDSGRTGKHYVKNLDLNLPKETKKMADNFVRICDQLGIFQSDIYCDIGPMWEDDVMFDWNNGLRPILTVVISTSSPKFVYSAKFDNEEFSGEDESLAFAGPLLVRFAKEVGITKCQNSAMQDLSLKAGSGVGGVASQDSTPQAQNYSYRCLVQQTSNFQTCYKQAGTSQSQCGKASSTAGLIQHRSSTQNAA